MQFTTLVFGTLVALTTGASAAKATVHNDCAFPVFVQSVPNNNAGPAGPVKKLAAGSGIYSETLRGSAIKISRDASLSSPLTMEYSLSGGLVYYDISNNAGNPFAAFRNKLTPADKACPKFNCAPHDNECYSSGGNPMIKACQPTSLSTTLCA